MPAVESEFLRAFREGFEQGNGAWNAGGVKTAYATLPDQVEYRLAPTWPEAVRIRPPSRASVMLKLGGGGETAAPARCVDPTAPPSPT